LRHDPQRNAIVEATSPFVGGDVESSHPSPWLPRAQYGGFSGVFVVGAIACPQPGQERGRGMRGRLAGPRGRRERQSATPGRVARTIRRFDPEEAAVKKGIHPEYVECRVTCGCGDSFVTRSVKAQLHVEICSVCHPFYTGKQKFVDTAGRIEKFQKKYAGKYGKGAVAAAAAAAATPAPAAGAPRKGS
jgi:large subunit ribosomal protein L31